MHTLVPKSVVHLHPEEILHRDLLNRVADVF